ncbi:hypothetical protein HPO96_03860 [Kribbella sandramycini]|uniref:Uncharacterized protein n=1 Tax=Kribbella sandramycini TaxID=60450 RepID=A0A7Y4KVA7_9ACTN|nr:hypothetical protein [Kribbella sandramycini]MBB6568031.1 hypothetical protein [Kribbella sandramycini]NOL39375.1 hypothetical protein [Kribbella sandramycini]
MTSDSRQVRLFYVAELTEMIRDAEPDERNGQLTAARASLALRRARLAGRALAACAMLASVALVWTLVTQSPRLSPWAFGAVLPICTVALGSLIRMRGRWRRLVEVADTDLGVPILAAISADAAHTVFLLNLYLRGAGEVAGLPEPIAVRSQLATIYSPMVNRSVPFFDALHRLREAWTKGDEQHWLAQNTRLAELCAEIDRLAERINAQIRDIAPHRRP